MALPPGVPVPLRGLLGLQELRLHAGHLTEVLGVCLWALHLTPADRNHLYPCRHPQSAGFLPAYFFFHISHPQQCKASSWAPQGSAVGGKKEGVCSPSCISCSPHREGVIPTCLAACHYHTQLILCCAQQVVGLCIPQ